MPSWCPDWRVWSHVNPYLRPEKLPIVEVYKLIDLDMPLYGAAITKACVGFFEDDKQLVCAGVSLDEIVHLSGDTDTSDDRHTITQKRCHRDGKPFSEEKINRDFWSIYTATRRLLGLR